MEYLSDWRTDLGEKKNQPIYYEFTACPIAEFAKQHDLLEVMPAICNPDYAAMELLHARLVRMTTCADGCKCDYSICGDRDEYLKESPEYVDGCSLLFIRRD